MMSFCWGEVLANTISVWYLSRSSRYSGLMSFRSDPCTTQALASLHTHTHTHAHTHTHTHTDTPTHTHTPADPHTHTHTHAHTPMRTHTHTHTHSPGPGIQHCVCHSDRHTLLAAVRNSARMSKPCSQTHKSCFWRGRDTYY